MIIIKLTFNTTFKFLYFSAVHCSAVLFNTVQGRAVQSSTVQYSVDKLGLVKCSAL